jgi:hypothetical protein
MTTSSVACSYTTSWDATRQTDVAVPNFAPVPPPTFTSAMIRFVASLGMLIGISLLLASL